MEQLNAFGAFFKAKRVTNKETLRQFCLKNGLNAGNISKIERGLAAPPKSREKMDALAGYLHIPASSEDWFEFHDLAAACTGTIPPDIQDDKQLVAKLPLLFKALRGKGTQEEKLRDLADLIRKI